MDVLKDRLLVIIVPTFIAAIVLCPNRYSFAADDTFSEYEIKAAFLFNFAKFIQWPDNAIDENPDVFEIGILGKDPFGKALDRIVKDEKVHERKVIIKRSDSPSDLRNCFILFICSSEESKLKNILSGLKESPVLTVGDMSNFAQAGGIVGFYMEKKKVRFEINLAAAAQANLNIRSGLLKLSRIVKEEDTQ